MTGLLAKLLTALLLALTQPAQLLRHEFHRPLHLLKLLRKLLPLRDADPMMQHELARNRAHDPQGQLMRAQGEGTSLGFVRVGHIQRIRVRTARHKTPTLAGSGKLSVNRPLQFPLPAMQAF